jgi:hypothetical protein
LITDLELAVIGLSILEIFGSVLLDFCGEMMGTGVGKLEIG